jgi:hypothetical protein
MVSHRENLAEKYIFPEQNRMLLLPEVRIKQRQLRIQIDLRMNCSGYHSPKKGDPIIVDNDEMPRAGLTVNPYLSCVLLLKMMEPLQPQMQVE